MATIKDVVAAITALTERVIALEQKQAAYGPNEFDKVLADPNGEADKLKKRFEDLEVTAVELLAMVNKQSERIKMLDEAIQDAMTVDDLAETAFVVEPAEKIDKVLDAQGTPAAEGEAGWDDGEEPTP